MCFRKMNAIRRTGKMFREREQPEHHSKKDMRPSVEGLPIDMINSVEIKIIVNFQNIVSVLKALKIKINSILLQKFKQIS